MSQMQQIFPERVRTSSFLGRPVWGRVTFSLRVLQQHRDAILRQADKLEDQGGGLVVIPYTEAQESSVLLLLTLLFGRLKQRKKPVQLYRSRLEPDLPSGLIASGYLLVHQLPQCDGLLDLLEAGGTSGRVVIATGLREEWEQLRIRLPHLFHQPMAGGEGVEAELRQVVKVEQEGYRQMGRDTRAYLLVALFDAWGIPLPFSLLARALNGDEDEVSVLVEKAQVNRLLFWIELEKPPALLVSTKSPLVARKMVGAEAGVLEEYATVIRTVDCAEKGERYTVLKLFQALLRGSHQWETLREGWGIQEPRRAWLLKLIRQTENALQQIWQEGDATEHLLWGKLFEELRDFERSDRIFQYGLKREPDNHFLLHARAKMLGTWARFDRFHYQAANQAFRNAANSMPDNPYIWQAWGVMEAELGNAKQAQSHFENALRAAQVYNRKRDALYTLIARSNLEIETGDYLAAERLLNEAEGLAPNSPYVHHLKGKKAFYEGNYGEAEEHLERVLKIDPVNVQALNTLGDMALKQGHWTQAEHFFHKAITIHPENIPTLHALGELWTERGDLAAAEGKRDVALNWYPKAEKWFRQILEWEPQNLQALVALGRLYTKWAPLEPERAEKAEPQLQEALRLHGQNKFALHALGELKRQQGRDQEAEQCFREVMRHDKDNLAALLSLAELWLDRGRRDDAQELLNRVGQIITAVKQGERYLPRHELIRAYNTWALVELKAENREQALAHVKQALERDRKNAYTHQTCATILEAMGNNEKARTHRKRARELGMVVEEAV